MKKKIIGAVLAALMLGGAVTVSALDTSEDVIVLNSEEEYTLNLKIHLLGDVTGEGDVTTIDFARANAHAKGTSTLTGYELQCADTVKSDGLVTTADAARINAHARGTSALWE